MLLLLYSIMTLEAALSRADCLTCFLNCGNYSACVRIKFLVPQCFREGLRQEGTGTSFFSVDIRFSCWANSSDSSVHSTAVGLSKSSEQAAHEGQTTLGVEKRRPRVDLTSSPWHFFSLFQIYPSERCCVCDSLSPISSHLYLPRAGQTPVLQTPAKRLTCTRVTKKTQKHRSFEVVELRRKGGMEREHTGWL